jgi:hypothetical protein
VPRDQLQQVWVVLLEESGNVVQPLRLRNTQQLRCCRCCCHRGHILRSHACGRQLLRSLLLLLGHSRVVLLVLAGCVLPVGARRGGRGCAHTANRA